jgi:uncharacterized lipoprotein YddW (UPF0748 family)
MDSLAYAGVDWLFADVTFENKFYYNTAVAGIEKDDHLSRVVKLAHERDIRVQPWVFPNGPINRCNYTPGEDGGYISGQPGGNRKDGAPCASWVKNMETGPIESRDMLDHHDIDGIHLDMVRYKDNEFYFDWPCQCKACKALYRKYIGWENITAEDLKQPGVLFKFMQLRQSCVRPAVDRLKQLADEYNVPISTAVRADCFNWALMEGQDWVQWARDGLFDFICTMNYFVDRDKHKDMVKQHADLINGCIPLYDGIGRFSSFGELDAKQMVQFADDAIDAGADGVSIFKLEPMVDEDFSALRAWRSKR